MAYDVSKKINVGLMKIYAQFADKLYLRKTDAEKEYLSLSGGKITGDVTFDGSNILFKNNSNSSKVSITQNGNLELLSNNNIYFTKDSNEYFVASPSYLSLSNKFNPISVEIVNEEGSGSPYGGLTVYDTKSGTPELISAINSGISDNTPYQWSTIAENGSFIWSVEQADDIEQIAKIDINGITLINKDENNNDLSTLRFQNTNGDTAEISSISGDMRLEASEIIFNNVASIGSNSIDLLSGSSIEFDSANAGVKMYSVPNSDTLTIDIKGKKFTVNENGFNGVIATSAAKAEKLSSERTISGGSDVLLNYKFDGSCDCTADIGFYACNAKKGNKNNYPFHRFAKIDLTSEEYSDWTTTLYISQGYNQGGFGICRISLRTNGFSTPSEAEVKWLFRSGLPVDFIQIGIDNTVNATHADAFVKIGAAYASTTIRAIASESRGVIKRTWILVDSEEESYTTESSKFNSVECYKSIENAATELHNEDYSEIISGSDATTQATVGRNNVVSTYITSVEPNGTNTLKVTYNNGKTSDITIPTS